MIRWLALAAIACGQVEAPAPASVDDPSQTATATATETETETTSGTEPTTPPDTTEEPDPAWDAVEVLIKASLDLRGVRPSVAEIEAIEADPTGLDATIEGFLDDARFESRVLDQFAAIYLTRRDVWDVSAGSYGLGDEATFANHVGQEPLRLLARIVAEGRPYSDLVTADTTLATDLLAEIWPLELVGEAKQGWSEARYTDGRPMAGILTTNGLWWRYMSDANNANRGRANALSKILLCSDYLTRPIEFDRDVDLLDVDAVNNALQNNPGCVACHSTLDPLAAHLWGFYYVYYFMASDITYYHPEREGMWSDITGVAPSYYGTPTNGLLDLAYQLAADPRLVECATQQVTEIMLQRPTGLDDTQLLTDYREAFLSADLRLDAVYRQVLHSDEYRTTPKMPTPSLLASQIEDLTGYRFTYAGYDMMETDTYGLRVLAGGVDGVFVNARADMPIATGTMVLERLSQAAAHHVVHSDAVSDEPVLFEHVGFTETPISGQDVMVEQIQALHLRLFGHRIEADGQEVEANLELWEDLYATDPDPKAAWTGLLSTLLRDPDFLLY